MKALKLLVFTFLLSTSLSAAHISSASISYKCLGNETYEYELIIYRDCNSNGAAFDNPVRIGVFLGEDFLTETSMEISSQEDIIVASYPGCTLNPDNYCIAKATYVFELNLPTQSEKYTVFYTRCCWAQSIANLLEPNSTGITVLSELSPFAQSECNSQEAFSLSLTTPLCSNVPHEISLATTDSEGDSLVYSMCLPYKGGGNAGATTPGNADDCDGVTPAPFNCPPTYEAVELLPIYSADNPFPTLNGFNIDSINGIISFIPTIQGTFLFGICVEEYRNGQLLSSQILNLAKWDEVVTSTDEIAAESHIELQSFSSTRLEFISDIAIVQNLKVQIFDTQGKMLQSVTDVSSNAINVDCQHLYSGLYFVKFSGQNVNRTLKVFVP